MSNLSVATLLKIYKDASFDLKNPHLYSSTIIDMVVTFLAKAYRWQEEALTDEQQSLLLCEAFSQGAADMPADENTIPTQEATQEATQEDTAAYLAFLNDVQDASLPAEKQAHHNPQFKHECKTILSHLARYSDGSSLVDVLKRLSDIDPGVRTMLCGAFNYWQEKGRKKDEGVGHEEYQKIAAAVSRYLVAGEFQSDFFLIIANEAGLESVCELLKGDPDTYRDARRNYNLLVGDVDQEFHKELLTHLLLASSRDLELNTHDQCCYQNFITCLTTQPQYEKARNQFNQLGIEINSLLPPKRAAAMANYPTGKAKEAAVEGDCQPQLFPRGGMFSAAPAPAPAQNTTSIRSRP